MSVWQRVYRGSKSGQRATLALTFGGKSTRLHAGWVHGWSATPFEEDGCARSRRIIRETQLLGAAPMLLGGTGRLDRRPTHCPPRQYRLCAPPQQHRPSRRRKLLLGHLTGWTAGWKSRNQRTSSVECLTGPQWDRRGRRRHRHGTPRHQPIHGYRKWGRPLFAGETFGLVLFVEV